MGGAETFKSRILIREKHSIFLMQACVEQKLPGRSFVGGYSSDISLNLDLSRRTVTDSRILHWRGFDAHVLTCFPVKCIFGVAGRDQYPALMMKSNSVAGPDFQIPPGSDPIYRNRGRIRTDAALTSKHPPLSISCSSATSQ